MRGGGVGWGVIFVIGGYFGIVEKDVDFFVRCGWYKSL